MKFVLTLVLLLVVPAGAQTYQLPPGPKQAIAALYAANEELAANPASADAKERITAMRASLLGKDQFAQSLADLHRQAAAHIARYGTLDAQLLNAHRARQRNRQGGESAAGGGSTSLTSLSGVTDFFSAAFESGALSRQSEGTVTTFRVSGYGVLSWLTNYQRPCAISNSFCDSQREMHLRGLSGSVSIDNSKPEQAVVQPTESNTTPPPVVTQLTGGGRVSSATVRYEFLQRVTPATPAQITEWGTALKAVEPAAAELSQAIQSFADQLNASLATEFTAWRKQVAALTDKTNTQAAFETAYRDLLVEFYRKHSPQFTTLQDVAAKRQEFHSALETALTAMLLKPAITLEYVFSEPSNQASISGLRLVVDKKIFKSPVARGEGDVREDSNGTLTLNASMNFYNTIPSGISSGRARDAQVSGQIERAIGPVSRKLRHSVSLAGYYQYQINNAILKFDQTAVTPGPGAIPLPDTAAVLLDTKGHIGIVQGKVTLRLTDSLTIPLAVSWSNRTELLPKDPTWRAQAGITLDVGNLLSK